MIPTIARAIAPAGFAVPFLLAFGCAMVCAHHLGTGITAQRICASLGYRYQPSVPVGAIANQICAEGAIPYLRYSPTMAATVVRYDVAHHWYLQLPVLRDAVLVAMF